VIEQRIPPQAPRPDFESLVKNNGNFLQRLKHWDTKLAEQQPGYMKNNSGW
jgi:hypothetical protein